MTVGFGSWRELSAHSWADADAETLAAAMTAIRTARTSDPARANRTTPRETTGLLRAIWLDEAGPADACANVRSLLGKHLQRERIARGFRDGDVRFSGKTGTFGGAF